MQRGCLCRTNISRALLEALLTRKYWDAAQSSPGVAVVCRVLLRDASLREVLSNVPGVPKSLRDDEGSHTQQA